MRAVVDTNILVSGIFWAGKPGDILKSWRLSKFDIFATVDILEEYIRVLSKVGKHEPDLVEDWVSFLLQHLILVEKSVTLRDCRDCNDNMFLECAVSASADCIVSGDADLLVLKNIQGIPILTATKFLNLLITALSP